MEVGELLKARVSQQQSQQQPWQGGHGRSRPLWIGLSIGVLGLLSLDGLIHARVESWWFSALDYGSVFWIRFLTQLTIFTGVGGLSWIWLWCNINLALRRLPQWQSPNSPEGLPEKWWVRSPQTHQPLNPDSRYTLPLFATLAIALILVAALELLGMHYGSLAWDSLITALTGWSESTDGAPLGGMVLESIPPRFDPQIVGGRLGQIGWGDRGQWWLGAAIITGVGLMVRPAAVLLGVALVQSLSFAWILGRQWQVLLLAIHPTPFIATDPLFEQDIGVFVFSLPLWDVLDFWLIGLGGSAVLSVMLLYLLGGQTLARGRFLGLTLLQQRHGCRLMGGVLTAIALSFWLSCFELVYSPHGVTYGASFTDIWFQFPVNTCLGVLGIVLGSGLMGYGITGQRLSVLISQVPRSKRRPVDDLPRPEYVVGDRRLTMRTVLLGLGSYIILSAIANIALPKLANAVIVKPNELEQERPFIARNIEYTQRGFGLEDIEVRRFEPRTTADPDILRRNTATIENIRLWDTRPLLETNRQLQQIRPYYRFASGDIDRYQFPETVSGVDSSLQQVILALREIDPESIPTQAQTWVNRHLAYTHGYGFTLSPVNKVDAGGLPKYFVKDISTGAEKPNGGSLTVDPPAIRQTIPIDRPRIYYGELASTYVMAPSTLEEFDYPSGDTNAYNHYDGRGGVQLSNPWRRMAFAWSLRDWQMLFARNLTPDTRVLFRRQIRERVRAIAPFLRYDSDPYGVVVNVGDAPDDSDTVTGNSNHLFWIIDAYTVSDRYPYSEPNAQGINYIRNAVKVIIDAYDGTVRFYTADPTDPILRTWQRIFPTLFQPLDRLPPALRRHLRYGNDLLAIQSERLLTYHMDNPQVFYNREDVWEIPTELYGNESQPVAPYFAILRLPGNDIPDTPEFVQLLPFSPISRNNLVAWLAARSDGENYGKLLLYQFPKDQQIFGVEQIEARINQEPDISEQIALWNREGSRAIQGNLLVIPLGETLLYVEPIYLEAVEQGLPTLARVIVVHENQIVMKPSLEEALGSIFRPTFRR